MVGCRVGNAVSAFCNWFCLTFRDDRQGFRVEIGNQSLDDELLLDITGTTSILIRSVR